MKSMESIWTRGYLAVGSWFLVKSLAGELLGNVDLSDSAV